MVQPTSSAPTEAERRYAEKITARMEGWLKESGIPTRILSDDQLTPATCAGTRVIILPNNTSPGRPELGVLQGYLASGGKLVVFYSADSRLAEMMGFKLGAFTASTGSDCWSAFRFTASAPPGVPQQVFQESRNIRPAYPANGTARVIAWWDAASGRGPREPAWVQSSRGFWMSHILLESDVVAKKQLLVALLSACDERLGQAAATRVLHQAGSLGLFADAGQAAAYIRARADQGGQASAVYALLAKVDPLRAELVRDYNAGLTPRVLASGTALDALLTEAFARIQTSRGAEFRGVWNHSGTGFSPGQWDSTCELLAKSGMTAILPNVQRPWCAHYPSKLIPASETLTRYGDQMGACLSAARRHGLETHAWVILWSLEGAPDALINSYRRAGRLQVSSSGKTVSWLCPAHPDNRAFELAALRDLAHRYPDLDGIQLDYIRYKSADTCYCNGCRDRFARDTGTRVRRWPADVLSGSGATAYRAWRRVQITRFVAAARQELSEAAPHLKLSASVYAGYPGCADSIAQDWAGWLHAGSVDFVCPMNYTARPERFTEWYRQQTAYPGVRGHLYAGIGITSLECRLSAVETLNQIALLRREGAGGFTLFEANPTLKNDILPYLKMGATAP